MNTTAGTGAFVRMGSLARTSPYLEVYNIYGSATTYPSDLGSATTKMVTDANGAISGYFLLPRTSAFKFKTGQQIFTLLDISAFNPENATTIAEFTYEASGVLQDIDQDILETRIVQYTALSNQLADVQTGSYTTDDGNDGGNGGNVCVGGDGNVKGGIINDNTDLDNLTPPAGIEPTAQGIGGRDRGRSGPF
jgi:hypothetical protein